MIRPSSYSFSQQKPFNLKTKVFCQSSWSLEYSSTEHYRKSSPFLCSGPESCLTGVSKPYRPHRTASCLRKDGYSLPQSQRMETLGTRGITLGQTGTQRCWCWHWQWLTVRQERHFSSSLSFQILQKLVWTVYMILGSKVK